MELLDRIKYLAERKHVTISRLEEDLGFSKNSIHSWKTKTPSVAKLKEVAAYFGVTTDYLLGLNNAPQWATSDDLIELDKLLNSDSNMTFGGESLTEEEKQRVNDVLTTIFWDKIKRKK